MLDEARAPAPDPLRVLIAEDETLIRLDLRGLLERRGFVCEEARDGLEAVARARKTQPDVAILDVKMPRLDGIEAARRIYAERPIPILMLTAYSERALVDRAIDAGVFAYLVKPFREEEVVPAVKAAVARHAELLAARRVAGGVPPASVEIELASPSGRVWPLRIAVAGDRTDVSLGSEADGT
jgi:CheY-like chemotaxis protein